VARGLQLQQKRQVLSTYATIQIGEAVAYGELTLENSQNIFWHEIFRVLTIRHTALPTSFLPTIIFNPNLLLETMFSLASKLRTRGQFPEPRICHPYQECVELYSVCAVDHVNDDYISIPTLFGTSGSNCSTPQKRPRSNLKQFKRQFSISTVMLQERFRIKVLRQLCSSRMKGWSLDERQRSP